MNYVWM